jgi:L-alanine-DL-glutamate epimerase-like enolase superfamily enzyme
MKIERVRTVHYRGNWDYHEPHSEMGLVRPSYIYPELRFKHHYFPLGESPVGPPYQVEMRFLIVDTNEGVSGIFGPLTPDDVFHIGREFASLLIGENPHAVERIWDKMYRTAIHGRKGTAMMALSKVDLALWDLKGKLLNAPVYVLLGGPSRSHIRAYASMLGYAVTPELVAERTKQVVANGYTAVKWFLQYAPSDGEPGIRKNLEIIRAAREAAGPDVDLLFDAWNSWDVPYTLRMMDVSAEYRPYWFEEPVMADLIPQYAELRRSVSGVRISGGEHEYTRWGIKSLLDAQAVHILQPDVTWAGGITEMTKICALASAANVPVIPHHGGWASTHLIGSQTLTTCPMQEWLFLAGRPNNVFLKHKLEPVNGFIELPTTPGLCMEIAESGLEILEEQTLAG